MSRIRRGSPLPGRLVLPAWAQDWPQQSVAGSRAALRRAASAPRSGPVQTSDERPQSCLQHGAIKPRLTADMVILNLACAGARDKIALTQSHERETETLTNHAV